MPTQKPWDFALHIKGLSLDSVSVARLAEYMKAFSDLLGEVSSPKFAGIVKGSVTLRVRDCAPHPMMTRQRIRDAESDDAPAHRPYQKLLDMMFIDGVSGNVTDHDKNILLSVTPLRIASNEFKEYIVHDRGEIDGIVVGITGKDDTIHARLQTHDGTVHSVTIRDLGLARELAVCFRLGVVRVHVHGTWKRRVDGVWEPNVVYADRVEDLDQSSAQDIFHNLAAIPNNGWRAHGNADELWRTIRGLDDCVS